jgi:hypothetical protein
MDALRPRHDQDRRMGSNFAELRVAVSSIPLSDAVLLPGDDLALEPGDSARAESYRFGEAAFRHERLNLRAL